MADLPASLRVGAMRSRWHRLIKNARWYLFEPGRIAKIGWGDLGLDNLYEFADALEADQAFVVLAENPRGAGQHLPWHDPDDPPPGWCWYDRPDDPPGPTAADLAHAATYAVIDNAVYYVDMYNTANRAGNVWISPGYRYTRTGRQIARAKVRLCAIGPEQLTQRLTAVVGDPDALAVTDFNHP